LDVPLMFLIVCVAYAGLAVSGFFLGRFLASRFRNDGPPGGGIEPMPGPDAAPTFGVEWQPLGSAFDRELLPGAFSDTDLPVSA
jgi:hypothetical protein